MLDMASDLPNHYKEFQNRFKVMSDEELLDAFKRDVGNPGWVSARGEYIEALRAEFKNRGLDYPDTGGKGELKMLDKKLQPSKITDLVDNIDIYLAEMRKNKDKTEIPKWLNQYSWEFFRETNPNKEQLSSLAIFLADHIYRYAAELKQLDDYTKSYFALIFPKLWDAIQSRGVDMFYILDNEIRADRFNLSIQLFALTGVAVVVPYVVMNKYIKHMTIGEQASWALDFDTEAFDPKKVNITIDSSDDLRKIEVIDLIKLYMQERRNIAYIEKDNTINFLDEVIDLAKNSEYVSVLRNKAPDDPNVVSLNENN